MEALVVFTNENNHWLGSALHPDFRHVYCVVPTAEGVVTEVNLTVDGVKLTSWGGGARSLRQFYAHLPETTHCLLTDYQPQERHLLPYVLNNCVGLTKQLLGRRDWSITPRQLFQVLSKEPDPCADLISL